MSDESKTKTYPPITEASANAHISSLEQYRELYDRSINAPDGFWTQPAERLNWYENWNTLREWNYNLSHLHN